MNASETGKEGHGHHKEFNIVVNGRAKKIDTQTLAFDDVVKLAFPSPQLGDDILFTVVFHNADQKPSDGTLVAGQDVKVRNGTSFDVTKTNRS